MKFYKVFGTAQTRRLDAAEHKITPYSQVAKISSACTWSQHTSELIPAASNGKLGRRQSSLGAN